MQMKFKAHQSFFLRKGWLGKGLKCIEKDESGSSSLFLPSNSQAAMDELGLGSNQVVALRYWLQTMGLIEYVNGRKRSHHLTPLGKLIVKEDPYTEEMGTLWALQCNLASASEDAASWYFFFNVFNMSMFNRDDFTRALERYVFTNNDKQSIARASLEADFNCILSTYIPHDRMSQKELSPESVIDCPLGELGLVDIEDRSNKTYRKTPANTAILPSLLVLYCICSMREHLDEDEDDISTEIKLETLLEGPYSPGRIFNLDAVSLLSKLYELENDGYLRITRTAGLDVVRLANPDLTKEDCLKNYYNLIG